MEKEESIKRHIEHALNDQTYAQFIKYAKEHYPGDPEKQGALVRQLQEQHYIQYMQQLQAVQKSESVVKQERIQPISDELEETVCYSTLLIIRIVTMNRYIFFVEN